MINLHESMGPDRDGLATPGSAVRHASVARHVTDCATRPGKGDGYLWSYCCNDKDHFTTPQYTAFACLLSSSPLNIFFQSSPPSKNKKQQQTNKKKTSCTPNNCFFFTKLYRNVSELWPFWLCIFLVYFV